MFYIGEVYDTKMEYTKLFKSLVKKVEIVQDDMEVRIINRLEINNEIPEED